MKIAAALLAAALLCALPANAAGMKSTHYVYNATKSCVWFTLDTASPISSWTNRHAAFVKPGEQVVWTIDRTTELKIRAQIRPNADCGAAQIADIDIVEKSGWVKLGDSETSLTGAPGSFHLKWGKP